MGRGLAAHVHGLPCGKLLVAGPVGVKPLGMHRVEGVLLALEPVARKLGERDITRDVVGCERLPERQDRGRRRTEVGEHQPLEFLHGVAGDLHLLLETPVRVHRLLEGLLDALPRLVHHPAVVHAAKAVLLRDAVGEIDPAVGAEPFDKAHRAGPVPVEDEVLAEDADGFGGAFVELRCCGDRVPVAAHEFAHGRAGAYSRQSRVLFGTQHRYPSWCGRTTADIVARQLYHSDIPVNRRRGCRKVGNGIHSARQDLLPGDVRCFPRKITSC